MSWMSVKEYATLKGISERAVQKAIAKGKHQVKEVAHPSRRDQIAYMIWTGEPSGELANLQTGEPTGELANLQTGEPSGELANLQTGEPECGTGGMDAAPTVHSDERAGLVVSERLSGGELALKDLGLDIPELHPVSEELPEKLDALAKRRAALLVEWYRYRDAHPESKTADLMDKFVMMYNDGLIDRDLRELDGTLSCRTLYRWHHDYQQGQMDYRALAPQYNTKKKSKGLQDDVNMICNLLFSDRAISIGSALNKWEWKYKREGKDLPASNRTMRRAVEREIAKNKGAWDLRQKGEKWHNEKRLPTLLQDNTIFSVHDQWQTDGKLANVMVVNPFTGRPQRPHLCAYMDTASTMPVGMSLDWSENSQMIQEAYLNSIMNTKTVPLLIKSDNGSGFKSESTLGEKEEIELQGVWYRSGVKDVQFHRAYNAKGKAKIERMFGTFTGQFEAYLRSFSGVSVAGKPAYMQRNEKWIRKLENREPLEVAEFKAALDCYILGEYANQAHPTIKGKTRKEVYEEGNSQLSASRRVKPELFLYMLRSQLRKVDNNGIKLRGIWYYNSRLYDFVGELVKIRYGMMEDRFVLVYSQDEKFICQANARVLTHPVAKHAGEMEQGILRHQSRQIRLMNKRAKKAVRELEEQYRNSPLLIDTVQRESLMGNGKYIEQLLESGEAEATKRANDPVRLAVNDVDLDAPDEITPSIEEIDIPAAEDDKIKINLSEILG